ncbi:MAG: YmdB family metallophosphoesterase [Oscillospiraceae bacterium]|nr:YmdB family metallophosphoesterase [Oscillospiraceae bacterium]
MLINILAIGDVCGQTGVDVLTDKLGALQRLYGASFTVVNGENAAGLGITKDQAQAIRSAGADVITLGNHTWNKREITSYLDDNTFILRPSNFAPQVPGRGWGIYKTPFGELCVINLIGRENIRFNADNPFLEADRLLEAVGAKIILVDFHAEMTSEKCAMAYYLDGRVTAVWGTHTHVQTSDAGVLPEGTGYITDLGMTGAITSVIGMKVAEPVSRFLGNPPGRLVPADGPPKIEGAVFEIDTDTGLCASAEAIRVI